MKWYAAVLSGSMAAAAGLLCHWLLQASSENFRLLGSALGAGLGGGLGVFLGQRLKR
jgi:hypothetical protein